MKRKYKVFARSFGLSSVIIGCMIFLTFGCAKAYENTYRIGFGENKKAVEFIDGNLRVFDIIINLKAVQ